MQDSTLRARETAEEPAKVSIVDGRAKVRNEGKELDLPIIPLPEKFANWIEHGRRSMYGKILGKSSPGFFTSHLPMVTTWNQDAAFPFNCSNKGVGFLPKPEYLAEFTELFRRTLEETRGRPWQESLKERIAAVSKFYFDRDKIDFRALSTLEIFEKGTYRNLSRMPLAAVHYTGNAPEYISFQVNCAVEIIKPDDPRHEFIHLARVMFEYDSFHISQTNFPYAYILWISEVLDKTPFRVPEKGNVIPIPAKGGLGWDPEAMESVNRAPGMIRQFITESIEKYARTRGFTHITMDIVREAREILERPSTPEADAAPADSSSAPPDGAGESKAKPSRKDGGATADKPYKDIYVGLDSSGPSDQAMGLAITLGKAFKASMTGSHVYAAKMHDNRFRAMEGGLPEEFQKEKELDRQRKIHDTLITKGLELITDSYLEAMAKECAEHGLPFAGVSLEGKNWKALADDIEIHDHDLVVIGGHGIGRVTHSQLGTVAERLLRRIRRDLLLVKVPEAENTSDEIMVCLDGSTRSWGGLKRALVLAKALGKKVTAVSAFDPYFHYAMFKSLNRTLTEKARKVFKFEEQEKLHEDIIDSGLAKIYQSYLNIAKRMAEQEGTAIEIKLLDGKPFEKILQAVRKSPPWLLVLGRIGFHSEEDMDVGGNTENLCRLAPCNILVVDAKDKPSTAFQAEETVAWTKEARAKLDRIPAMAQGMAMQAIQNYCVAEGFTVVTESILKQAVKTLLPPEALKRMGMADDEPAASGNSAGTSAPATESHDRIALSFKCQACGHVHHGSRPHLCPICGMGGHMFKLAESAMVEDGQVLATLGDRQLIWEKPALAALEALPDALAREQTRNRLEKRALTQRLGAITLEMVLAEVEPAGAVWTEEALKRLVRVPEGFMRNAAKGMIEEHARKAGLREINLDAAEAGLGKAREKMQASMQSVPAAAEGPSMEGPVPEAKAEPIAWECHLCGFVVVGAKPIRCGNCGAGHSTPMTAESRAQLKPAALSRLEWDEDAAARLERVPVGFMRDMTRSRVEKWARAAGLPRVNMEVMDGKYGSWAAGSAKHVPELEWSDEARARAERIPEFIRPMVMMELERRVKSGGGVRVEARELDEAMRQWSGEGRFHGHG